MTGSRRDDDISFCDCGVERCSRPWCDSYCMYAEGWEEAWARRNAGGMEQLWALSGLPAETLRDFGINCSD